MDTVAKIPWEIFMKKWENTIWRLNISERVFPLAKNQNVIRNLLNHNGLSNVIFQNRPNRFLYLLFKRNNLISAVKLPTRCRQWKPLQFVIEMYKSQNKSDSTIKYLEKSAALRDSLFSREKQRQFQNITFSEQFRAQEMEAARKEYQSRFFIYSLIGITFTLIVIVLAFFINGRRKQKTNELLENKNRKYKVLWKNLKPPKPNSFIRKRWLRLANLLPVLRTKLKTR